MPTAIPRLRSIHVLCSFALALGGLTAPVQAADSSDLRLVTVFGEAEVRVVPDEALLTVIVSSFDPTLDGALAQNESRVKQVLEAAGQLGIEPKHVQTGSFAVDRRYKTWQRKPEVLGYAASREITITLRDLSRFDALLQGVVVAGISELQGVDFRTTELRTHRDEARRLALQAAREKALAMVGTLDARLGRLHSIEEKDNGGTGAYSWWGRGSNASSMQNTSSDAGSVPVMAGNLAPGQISVTSRVVVRFELD